MNNILTKLSNMINDDEMKKCITQPMFNYLYNELYLYIWILCFYQIIYFIIILFVCYALFEIHYHLKFLKNNLRENISE